MGSVSDADLGVAQVALGLAQGVASGILPCDPGKQGLQGAGPAEALQITDQGQGTIAGSAPSQRDVRIEMEHQQHGPTLAAETLQLSISARVEAHRTQAGLQKIGIQENRWQDGEMGHGHHDHLG
jgi:hypothetical protein